MFIPGDLGSANNSIDLAFKKFKMNVNEKVQDVFIDFH